MGSEGRSDELAYPWVREELVSCLGELAAPDPRIGWREQRERGLVSGINQVFHFFFDDHPFDRDAIGHYLADEAELASIDTLRRALDAILLDVGDKGDDAFVQHPSWPRVTEAACVALTAITHDGE